MPEFTMTLTILALKRPRRRRFWSSYSNSKALLIHKEALKKKLVEDVEDYYI